MPQANLNRFFVSVVLPSILAIGLFILAIFLIILPAFEKNNMEGKKEMLSELTRSVSSLIEEYKAEAEHGIIPEDSARLLALERVGRIRYGEEGKDYFWITDMQPVMLMHPYRPELIGKNLEAYSDPDGKLLFVESVELVRKEGMGFLDYRWQWKDDSTRIVPKLSYVQEFPDWGWVVGTGIYLEDVRLELQVLKRRLLRVALLITLIISVILAFIIRQSLGIERQRRMAEMQLRLSREKYKNLVEASTEGTLMLAGGRFIFSNRKFSALSAYETDEIEVLKFEDLFSMPWSGLESMFDDPARSVSRETTLICKDGSRREIVISASRIKHDTQEAFILIVKEVSATMYQEQEARLLSEEMSLALNWMQRHPGKHGRPLLSCDSTTTALDAAKMMIRKGSPVIFVRHDSSIIGHISLHELSERVLGADGNAQLAVLGIMNAPVLRISEKIMLWEALMMMKKAGQRWAILSDATGSDNSMLLYEDLILDQENMLDILMKDIESARDITSLRKTYSRMTILVSAMIESGSTAQNLTRTVSLASDAIHRRVLDFCLEELGEAPRPFAFIVLGSQGRNELSLASDQDNAIILSEAENPGPMVHEDEKEWFLTLGRKINDYLEMAGFKKCPGDIMAGNPRWNVSLETWKDYFSGWLKESDPQAVLDTSIFFDFKWISGEEKLVKELRDHVIRASQHKAVFLYHMAQSVQKMKIPSLSSDLELKRWLMPVQAYLRIFALGEELVITNSFERASALKEKDIIDRELYMEIVQALETLTQMRFKQQTLDIAANNAPGNVLDPGHLNPLDRHILKKIISDVQGLQTRLASTFSN